MLTTIDQHMSVPVSPANESGILSFQVPLAAVPDLPLNVESGCSGRKLPTNGADPLVIKLAHGVVEGRPRRERRAGAAVVVRASAVFDAQVDHRDVRTDQTDREIRIEGVREVERDRDVADPAGSSPTRLSDGLLRRVVGDGKRRDVVEGRCRRTGLRTP